MKVYFRALRHRNYRLYFGGQTLSLFGTWMQQVAQSWFLYRLTASPVALGVLALAQFGPACVGTPIGGAIVDRHDKRSLLLVALNAFLQAEAPDGLRGRVIALYAGVFAGGVSVGGLLAGWLAVRIGEGAVIGAGGLLVAAGAGILLARQRRG